jgi:hypothetical protein
MYFTYQFVSVLIKTALIANCFSYIFLIALFSLTCSLRVRSMELSLLELIALQLPTGNGTPKFCYHFQKISPLVYAPSLINSVYSLTPFL